MAVYVDDVKHRFGRMVMCHLWADSLAELLVMVDAIGVQRKWIQGHPDLSAPSARPPKVNWVHFDISLSKKAEALKRGAILTDRFGPAEHCARLKGDEATLEMIYRCRARRAKGELEEVGA